MNTPSIPPGATKNILLVDDDDDIRALLGYQLKRAGYTVATVSNGCSALKALQIQCFDLLITDALMPEMSGYELAQAVRATGEGSQLPIMMLTALDTEHEASMLSHSGVDHFENKPYAIGPLLVSVARLLAGKF